MSHLELKFGSPHHGWLGVELADANSSVSLEVSDVPGDSLAMLAAAALDIATGQQEARVVWFLEPAEATWVFQRVGDRVQVRAIANGTPPALMVAGSAEEFSLVIWRALRHLESDPAWTHASAARVWSHPFPHREVAQLGVALGRTSGSRRS
ncbi:hypothetical protein NR798_26170 [Archangium gephyra]|uniref:hypothetical protein n=1 Tax=Archangium gephyra TaxID=48 RepID=UPI0035D4EC10